MRRIVPSLAVFLLTVLLVFNSGCGLREIRTKTKFGVEARHTNKDKSHVERYLVQEALQLKWDNGVDTSLIYRRRDVSNSESSDADDGVWFEIGIPLWKAPKKPDEVKTRMAALERRVAELEEMVDEPNKSAMQEKSNGPPRQPASEMQPVNFNEH